MPRPTRDHTNLELLGLLTQIDQMTDVAEIPGLLAKLLELYGLESVAYLGAGLSGRPQEGPFLAVTYSAEWVARYKGERFVEIDPAIQVGMRRLLPIDWSEFDRNDEKVRRLFGEAAEFGLGRQGLSLPVRGRNGDRALVSITSDAHDGDWKHLRFNYLRDFQLLALHLHQAILHLEGGERNDRASLSPRERECLLWIAEGKTYWECAMILGLSEHTVRCYLESARHKLGAANTVHAVNKAGKASLLSDLP
ncbi:LuxR family transcriptional regulator [Mesorhizobium sp. B2-5-13]|uniref:LuxR family transcriptional regulator n=1 Tax=unclassified Mesorhizobium TaxID=325217 RepID=UPI001126E074|nr:MULTISPECIES: LuxR family transcriptional regulator [unclassified Mesorhizobium]TPJ81943.1 LuxR family transcriptional regulator [Mesorhizobium sp. B2-5-13]TPK45880.1 LuxR family transcriptional regulator [Mesorhizobium sp. B2-5-5]